MGIESYETVITPEEAARLLAHNKVNRVVRQGGVDRYAIDMAAGQWSLNGAAISLDEHGNVLDGQHRLLACVKAGVFFPTIMVTGLPVEAQKTMDVGIRRTLADLLRWRKETNASSLAAAVNMGWKWREDRLNWPVWPTHQQALDWLEVNPSVRDALRKSFGLRELYMPPSAATSFAHQAALIDGAELESFMKQLSLGENLNSGDPILALRSWAINQVRRQGSGTKPDSVTYLAMFIKCWNAWIMGRRLTTMVWRRGGSQREEFPSLLDCDGQVVAIADEMDH